jgi:hypothetical protein
MRDLVCADMRGLVRAMAFALLMYALVLTDGVLARSTDCAACLHDRADSRVEVRDRFTYNVC